MASNLIRWICATVVLSVHLQSAAADNWPEWRGNHGDGTSDEKGLPTKWTSTDNVAWKVALPEPGNSTPVV